MFTLGGSAQYVGLRHDVRYRIELGFAFVDDGDRMFKIRRALFEQAIGARPAEPEELATITALVHQHETVFCLFPTHEAATSSVAEKEL